jgi:hypothetical protein
MKKQKMEIEVEIPNGYELSRVCTGEHPELGPGEEVELRFQLCGVWHFVVVRPEWKWPDWLTAEWIAMDKDGEWWSHEYRPFTEDYVWDSTGGMMRIDVDHIAFTPPPRTDWTQSLRRNPKAEVKQ